ncbi:hypothetical protein I41_21350 [Lacipirellula limnantheis]|uniref:Uncharacterized protein n=2 Tax=Lacipirellula limnantheis TaxID=2528024 RepID=A0A517TX43_9BACT|nr:hypothetical protein I41_21350 [Lacipirellula limnantheis]
MHRQGFDELTQPAKAELLGLLTLQMRLCDQSGPLLVMLQRTVASLARCYAGEAKRLEIPVPADSPLLAGAADDEWKIAKVEQTLEVDQENELTCKSPDTD